MPVSIDDARTHLEDIADNPESHKLAITNLIQRYRRLGKWIKMNSEHLGTKVGVQTVYTMGVTARVLELCGYRLGKISMTDVDVTAQQVMETFQQLLPLDDELPGRLAEISWVAEPGILQVLVDDLFSEKDEDEEDDQRKSPEVLFQAFVLVWLALEVIATASQAPEAA